MSNGLKTGSLSENFTELLRVSAGPIHFGPAGKRAWRPVARPQRQWWRLPTCQAAQDALAQEQGESMRYGYFDDENREYVITRPDTPLPWVNYLGADEYFGIISNTAGGYSWYRDARLRRITRYRYN